jgi:hypothetical protein
MPQLPAPRAGHHAGWSKKGKKKNARGVGVVEPIVVRGYKGMG